jgi:hypothetical protein
MPRWLYWPDTILYNTFVYCAFSVNELRPIDPVNGTFVYCAFSVNELRPIDPVNGTFVYCAFDLNNSGFDRTP